MNSNQTLTPQTQHSCYNLDWSGRPVLSVDIVKNPYIGYLGKRALTGNVHAPAGPCYRPSGRFHFQEESTIKKEAATFMFNEHKTIPMSATYGLIIDPNQVKSISDLVTIEIPLSAFTDLDREATKTRRELDLDLHQYCEVKEGLRSNLLEDIEFVTRQRMIELLPTEVDLSILSITSLESILEECEQDLEDIDVVPEDCREDWWYDNQETLALAIKTIEDEIERKEHQLHIQKSSGYVYLLKSVTGYWKIGRTVNPQDRIRTFSVKLPFEVEYEHLIPCVDHVRAELELHERFASKRTNGEWFCLDENEVAYIKSLKRL